VKPTATPPSTVTADLPPLTSVADPHAVERIPLAARDLPGGAEVAGPVEAPYGYVADIRAGAGGEEERQ
jgi:hypothetical protein